MLAERGRHADDDGVALGEAGEVGRRLDPAVAERLRDPLLADVADVGLAPPQRLGLPRVDVEADDAEARLLEEEGERQADVAEADDADPRGAVGDLLQEVIAVFVHAVWDASTGRQRVALRTAATTAAAWASVSSG